MAIAYESIAETTFAAGLTLTIAKPSGLAVGDYMFAQCISVAGVAWNTPSGWTALYNNSGAVNLGGGPTPSAIFYKQADSSDVAASNFSFTVQDQAGASEFVSGNIIRVSGLGIIDGSVSNKQDPVSSSPISFATSIDPVFTDGLVLWWSFAGDNIAVSPGISSPSIATDNPTWTSRSTDTRNNAAGSGQRVVYSAPRSAATAFGNATISVTTNVGLINVIANLAPLISGSHTVVTGTSYFVNHPFLRTGVLEVEGQEIVTDFRNVTQWTNESSPSTTWTNEQL